jgi:hypothetical protein
MVCYGENPWIKYFIEVIAQDFVALFDSNAEKVLHIGEYFELHPPHPIGPLNPHKNDQMSPRTTNRRRTALLCLYPRPSPRL